MPRCITSINSRIDVDRQNSIHSKEKKPGSRENRPVWLKCNVKMWCMEDKSMDHAITVMPERKNEGIRVEL